MNNPCKELFNEGLLESFPLTEKQFYDRLEDLANGWLAPDEKGQYDDLAVDIMFQHACKFAHPSFTKKANKWMKKFAKAHEKIYDVFIKEFAQIYPSASQYYLLKNFALSMRLERQKNLDFIEGL